MKEFRIAPYLTKDGTKDFAIFKDGSRKKLIKSSDKYGKYFEVDNDLNPNGEAILKFSFSGRIKDAVETIRNGGGDVISIYNMFGEHITVQYFIDRSIGDELRQKSIDGWKDTKFAWIVTCGNKNSFSGYAPINDKGERVSMFDKNRNPKIFDTEEAARKFMDDLISKAAEHAKNISNAVKESKDKAESDSVISKGLDNIEENAGTGFSVILNLVSDMLTGEGKLKYNDCSLDEWGYHIEQYVVQD